MEISFHLCHVSQLEALTYTGSWQGQDNSAMSWDCVCLSRNMQGALVLTQRSQGQRCSREVSCPAFCSRDHESGFMGRSKESWVCGTRALVVLVLPSMQGINSSAAWLPPTSPKGFLQEAWWAPGCHPQSKALFQTRGFYCLSGFLKDQPETFLALSRRSEEVPGQLTQLIAFYSYAIACVEKHNRD